MVALSVVAETEEAEELAVDAFVRSFSELPTEERQLAGGKGGTLARLRQAGYPVPDGLVIMPHAFSGDELTSPACMAVQGHLTRLRQGKGGVAFAVRSSALSEDELRRAVHSVRRSRRAETVQACHKAQGLGEGHEIEMAVVVQRLMQAELSAVRA